MSEEDQHVEDIKPDKDGKYPETVSWNQYVGIKESLGKKLDTATQKVTSLEEQLGKATSVEEFNRVKEELETTKTKLQETTDELTGIKEKSVSEKREILTKRGMPEEKVKEMSEEQLNGAIGTLEYIKPLADLGGGGGSGGLTGSPIELARRAYGSK